MTQRNEEPYENPAFENALEDAAKAAFIKAQSVYRADHDHFPLRSTWETTTESVREGWRGIAYAALEAAEMPPLGTQPEPRQRRTFEAAETNAVAVKMLEAVMAWMVTRRFICPDDEYTSAELIGALEGSFVRMREAIEYAHAHGFSWPSDPLPKARAALHPTQQPPHAGER